MVVKLTENMVIARSKISDLAQIKKFKCWGAELEDVSLLRKMPNVEVLTLSLNKIRSLADFAWCLHLRELSVRQNEIEHLSEIRHLKRLPYLTNLWLQENPCAKHSEYRPTVIRNLPNLLKLDNIPVSLEEIQDATKRGVHIPEYDDSSGHAQEESDGSGEESSEPKSPLAPTCPPSPHRDASPADERYEHPAMTTSHYEPRSTRSSETASLKHSVSVHSLKDFACSSSNVDWRQSYEAPAQDCYERASDRCDTRPVREWERGETGELERGTDRGGSPYPSAVSHGRRGVTRRPVTRNSNLLSAVLCLVKELDYPSLEAVEVAVRSRKDDLANGQRHEDID